MLERATRECATSPQMAISSPVSLPLGAADGERIEQRLGRVLVETVARIDDGAADALGDVVRKAPEAGNGE